MSRDRLRQIKASTKREGFEPSAQLVHSLIDHGLQVLDELEGGQSTIEQRAALKERERQVRLALVDLRVQLAEIQVNIPVDVEPAIIEGQPLVDDLSKSIFTLDMVDQMLKAKGPQWHREWNWYRGRIDEEFGA